MRRSRQEIVADLVRYRAAQHDAEPVVARFMTFEQLQTTRIGFCDDSLGGGYRGDRKRALSGLRDQFADSPPFVASLGGPAPGNDQDAQGR
jgi:hypothetical protein